VKTEGHMNSWKEISLFAAAFPVSVHFEPAHISSNYKLPLK
jgi:hypothetical protein